MTAEEAQIRVDLAACYRLVHRYGLSDLIYTHITARLPGEQPRFLINPYGLLFDEITASSLITIDLEGRVLHNPDPAYDINFAGYVIHSAVHGGRADAHCVIHTHSRAGVAVSALKCGLLPLSQWSMRFTGRLAYHAYEGPAVDMDERQRLVEDLGAHDAMILRNHGLLAVGPTVAEAFNTLYWLERACQAQLDALACNTELSLPAAEVALKTAHLYKPGVRRRFGLMEWPTLLRLLDREDPSYRD